MLFKLPDSENIFHYLHLLDLKEIKDIQQKENVIIADKKFTEINDLVVIKKKRLYKIVVPMLLHLHPLEKNHIQFGHLRIYKIINYSSMLLVSDK